MPLWDRILRIFGVTRTQWDWRVRKFKESFGKSEDEGSPRGKLLRHRQRGSVWSWLIPEETPFASIFILSACIGLYFVTVQQSVAGALDVGKEVSKLAPSTWGLLRYGASNALLVADLGQWWRLATANFLHGNLVHIGFNAYGIWVIGHTMEELFGRAKTFAVVIVTGVFSQVVSHYWRVSQGEMLSYSVGASGAVFGILACVSAHTFRYPGPRTREIRSRMVPWLLFALLFGFSMSRIDNAAHVGGMLAGVPFGWFLADKDMVRQLPKWIWVTIAWLLLIGVGFCFYMAGITPMERFGQ